MVTIALVRASAPTSLVLIPREARREPLPFIVFYKSRISTEFGDNFLARCKGKLICDTPPVQITPFPGSPSPGVPIAWCIRWRRGRCTGCLLLEHRRLAAKPGHGAGGLHGWVTAPSSPPLFLGPGNGTEDTATAMSACSCGAFSLGRKRKVFVHRGKALAAFTHFL